MKDPDDQVISSPSVETLLLLGGELCLDFANTMDPRAGPHPRDFLVNAADVVRWGRHVGVLTEGEAQRLLSRAQSHSREYEGACSHAIALREAIYGVFSSIAARNAPQRSDLDLLQDTFAQSMAHAHLLPTSHGFEWEWNESREELDAILWPVACSAVDLLRSEERRKVKECPGIGDCGWLFVDTSKNGSRHWCSMQDCGSRAKMRRLYARKRASRSQRGS